MDYLEIIKIAKEDKSIDISSFKLFLEKDVNGEPNEVYYSDKKHIYYLDYFFEFGPHNHGPKFKIISENKNYEIIKMFTHDTYRVNNSIIKIDKDYFEVFDVDINSFGFKYGVFFDKNKVYTYYMAEIEGISSDKLEVFGVGNLIKNSSGLFHDIGGSSSYPNFKKVENIDLDSFIEFKHFNSGIGYFKDIYNVYFLSFQNFEIIKYADPINFDLYDGALSENLIGRDNSIIFNGVNYIKNSDPATLLNIEGRFYKDKNNVYYLCEISSGLATLEGVDSSTFSYNTEDLEHVESESYRSRTKNYFFKDKDLYYKLYEEEGFDISGKWNYGREKLEYVFKLEKSKLEFDY